MEQQIKELYKKQIELLLNTIDIHRKSGCVDESKRFMNLSKNPISEIKQFYIKFNSSYDEKVLIESIKELLPELYVD